MSEPCKTVLWANALVASLEKTNLFYCDVCIDDTSFVSWQDHISKPTHIENLQKFNATFESQGSTVRCKLCNKYFDRIEIKIYGKLHSNCIDNYERFFKNYIIEWKDKFYCYLCFAIFDDSDTAIEHIDALTHKNLKEKSSKLEEFLVSIPPNETYRSLVSEGFSPVNDNTAINCKFCKLEIAFDKTKEHAQQFYHQYFKVNFNQQMDFKKAIGTDNKEINSTSIISTNNQKLQTSQMQKTKSVAVSTNIPCDYIVRLNAMDFYCQVCELKLSEAKIIDKHLLESSHTASLSKYGCDGISMQAFNDYHCKYCNCFISGRSNVYLHIKGRRHACSLLISRRHQLNEKIKTNEVESKPDRPEWSKALSLMIDELGKLAEQLKTQTRAKKSSFPRRNFANQRLQLVDDNTTCNLCSSILINSTDLHCHMAGHFSMEFYCSCVVDENSKDKENCRAGKVQIKQNNIGPSFANFTPIKVLSNNNNLHLYQPHNNMNNNSKIFNTSAIIAGNYAPVEIVTIKNTDEIIQSSSENSTTNVVNTTILGSEISNDRGLKKTAVPLINGNYVREKNDTIEDAKVFRKIDENVKRSLDDEGSLSNTNDDNTNSSKLSSVSWWWNSSHSDDEFSSDSETRQKIITEPIKTTMKEIIKLLDFDKDSIYEMKEKKREIELGIRLSLIINDQNIYCLICRKNVSNTPQNYFDHLSSLDHSEYLEGMEKDHALFEVVTGQFSELDLACQYMEEATEQIIQCLICDEEIINDNNLIQNHIEHEFHEFVRDQEYIFVKKHFQDFDMRMQCNWYNVHKYWCVPCSANFETEVNFVKHLENKKHLKVMYKRENRDKTMIYDFCAPCALLWYGYRCTYSYHCDVPSHKWLLRDGHYSLPDLPKLAKSLLVCAEKFIDDTVNYLDSVATEERAKENYVITDLQNAVKPKFSDVKAYVCGSRASGLSSPDSDIDIFLDCGNRYNGNVKSESISNLMDQVEKCLMKDSQTWDVNELITESRFSFIRVNHRASGLFCNISLENGLCVENTKLIKSFNDIFPSCRKLTLFVKKWLAFCNLSGSLLISSYAICWYVIFYLQKESMLPSIATLISMNDKSRTIDGWEVGVTHEFSYNKFENVYSLKELLIRFFKFYANFDFRYDVACPLIGDELKKRAFTDPHKLPKQMAPYIAYIDKSTDPEPLRIDSVMCIQDPFDLQHNITKNVSKVFLSRFRTCCSKSLDVLLS